MTTAAIQSLFADFDILLTVCDKMRFAALISVMTFAFARIGAVVAVKSL